MIRTGMCLVQYFPVYIVDIIITLQAKLKYGDLSTYGIYRPKDGPLYLKNTTGKSAVIDFGTIEKIKEGAIKVVPSNIKKIEKKNVIFENNMEKEFDVIVFATGYKSVANGWLKVDICFSFFGIYSLFYHTPYNYKLNDFFLRITTTLLMRTGFLKILFQNIGREIMDYTVQD